MIYDTQTQAEYTKYGLPYGLMNYSALWVVLALAAAALITAYIVVIIKMTKPLPVVNEDDIYFAKTRGNVRKKIYRKLSMLETEYLEKSLSMDEYVQKTLDTLTEFIQRKTRINIAGMAYSELIEKGAPVELLQVRSVAYYIMHAPMDEGSRRSKVAELASIAEMVVRTWR